MSTIVKFPDRRPPARKGNTLCKRGFHKWQVAKDRPFDVKKGRLVSLYHCTRCGATRSQAD